LFWSLKALQKLNVNDCVSWEPKFGFHPGKALIFQPPCRGWQSVTGFGVWRRRGEVG
jgi:hypothetical protein